MLEQKFQEDLKESLKNKDENTVGTLRLMIAACKNKAIEKKGKGESGELTNDDVLDVLMKESKKRKEAMDLYLSNGREDLAEKEKTELDIIARYLPEQMEEGEIEGLVSAAIEKLGASGKDDFGRVMKEVTAQTKGRADSKVVSEKVKAKLGL